MATPKELYYEKRGKLLVENLKSRHFDAYYCENAKAALEQALALIPTGASVGWGGTMSAAQIGLQDAIRTGNFRAIDRENAKSQEEKLKLAEADFVCLNFANGDMVGHTGIYEAIWKAVKAVDSCVERVVTTARENGYDVFVTADHGNADYAQNPDGSPNTAHSLNPVPLIVVSDNVAAVKDGALCDIAPSILELMGIKQPEDMTGHSLITLK